MRFYGYGYENHSEEVHKVWLSEINWLEQLFLTFWKKLILSVSDSTFFIKNEQKSSKVRKSGFWWHFWIPHWQFIEYRVVNCQNWIKIVGFTFFLNGFYVKGSYTYWIKKFQEPMREIILIFLHAALNCSSNLFFSNTDCWNARVTQIDG